MCCCDCAMHVGLSPTLLSSRSLSLRLGLHPWWPRAGTPSGSTDRSIAHRQAPSAGPILTYRRADEVLRTRAIIADENAPIDVAVPAESLEACAVRRILGHQLGLFFDQSVSSACLTHEPADALRCCPHFDASASLGDGTHRSGGEHPCSVRAAHGVVFHRPGRCVPTLFT